MSRPALLVGLLGAVLAGGCKSDRKEVVVFAAASLARAISDLEEPFERAHPGLDLRLELGGSQEICRRVAELGRPADVVATSDGKVIDEILRPRYARFNLLFTANELTLAHADGSYTRLLARLARFDVLVLDDWGLAPLRDSDRRDLLEIFEDRHGLRSTLLTSQLPIEHWHDHLGEATVADAICDRLLHNAHRIALQGPSWRKENAQPDA